MMWMAIKDNMWDSFIHKEVTMKAIKPMESNMGSESFIIKMEEGTKDNGKKDTSMGKDIYSINLKNYLMNIDVLNQNYSQTL